MTNDERWLEFRYQYIEMGWFDYDRCKTIEAMRKLSKCVPEEVLDNLPSLTVFAPSAALLGHALPCGTGDSIFVYLSPRLESKSSPARWLHTLCDSSWHPYGRVVQLALGNLRPADCGSGTWTARFRVVGQFDSN
jgi:hypothetical protein